MSFRNIRPAFVLAASVLLVGCGDEAPKPDADAPAIPTAASGDQAKAAPGAKGRPSPAGALSPIVPSKR